MEFWAQSYWLVVLNKCLAPQLKYEFNFIFLVCIFPYVMAFTQDSIEIRLIINGSLVHTLTMPDVTLVTSKVRKLIYGIYTVISLASNPAKFVFCSRFTSCIQLCTELSYCTSMHWSFQCDIFFTSSAHAYCPSISSKTSGRQTASGGPVSFRLSPPVSPKGSLKFFYCDMIA